MRLHICFARKGHTVFLHGHQIPGYVAHMKDHEQASVSNANVTRLPLALFQDSRAFILQAGRLESKIDCYYDSSYCYEHGTYK